MSGPDYKCVRILRVKTINSEYLDLTIQDSAIPSQAGPGQFVMIRGWAGNDPILARPFDIVETDCKNNTFRLVVKIVGRGTRLLEQAKPGNLITVLGPLGQRIKEFSCSSIGLLSRGVGAAALVLLAREARKVGVKVYSFMSASTSERLVCKEDLETESLHLEIATDDGSRGYRGNATDLVEKFLSKKTIDRFYTCGSKRFARYIKRIDRSGKTNGYAFLERIMACGRGHCHGCSVAKDGDEGYYLLCRDGPVFPVSRVVLE